MAMNDQARLEARLELDPRAATVVGTVTGGDGVERRFCGWMEFASVIEAWRGENAPAADRPAPRSPVDDRAERRARGEQGEQAKPP